MSLSYEDWVNSLPPEAQAQERARKEAWLNNPNRGNEFYHSGDYGTGDYISNFYAAEYGSDQPMTAEQAAAAAKARNDAEVQELVNQGYSPADADEMVRGKVGEGNEYLGNIRGDGLTGVIMDNIVNPYLNSGQNNFRADPYAVDPNAYNYGGYEGGAQDWSDQALAQGQRSQQYEDQYAMQGAEAIQAGRQNMYASEDPLLSGKEEQSRYYQGDSLGLAQQAAYGNAPSVAQNQLTYGIGRTIADQASAASSARGAAAMAMAQQNAMGNSAQALGDYNNQMAMLRAQEMAAARAAYQQGTEQMRGQDQSRLTQSNQVSQFNAGQGQNEAQLGLGLAQLGLGYGNQAQGYNAQAQNVQGQQLQAQGNQQAQNSQNQQAANSINSGIASANAAAKAGQVNKVIGAGLTAATTVAGGPIAGQVTGGAGNAGGIGGTNPNTGVNPNSGTKDPYYGQTGY